MAGSRESLGDAFGRRIEYVRVSITERCDYRCVFCMPAVSAPQPDVAARLSTDETLRLCRVLSGLGVDSFKVTGGEPFMNPDADAILENLKQSENVRCVTVTTNGSTLDRHVDALVRARVDCVNVSLGGFRPETYAGATRSRVAVGRVLNNILLAKQSGLAVKINMVPIHGVNGGDIVPMVEFALGHGIPIRFIELMPMGEGCGFRGLTRDEVAHVVEQRFGAMTPAPERVGNGPAVYSRVEGYDARIGYIAALSGCFCAACNRIRLTSRGFLKTCLHSDHGVDLAAPLRDGEGDDALAARIRAAVNEKPERHVLGTCPGGGASGGEPMYRIGG